MCSFPPVMFYIRTMGPPLKTLRQITAEQIRAHRKRRGMTQQELADRLATYGARIDRTAVAKIEAGASGAGLSRDLALAEMFAFALALDVAPVHLLVPIDSDEPIRLAPNLEASPYETREWIRGRMPLFQDPTVYWTTVPENERAGAAQSLASWLQSAPIQVTTRPEDEN